VNEVMMTRRVAGAGGLPQRPRGPAAPAPGAPRGSRLEPSPRCPGAPPRRRGSRRVCPRAGLQRHGETGACGKTQDRRRRRV